jgi:beta-lactamase superfamily II metal-dependent hydrolase
VLLLEWGSFRVLLPVGLDFETMDALLKDHRRLPVTALLLAGGGYAPLNPPEWIERWQPQAALLSVSAGNARGLPDRQTLEALEGITVLRTDRNGWIELSTDGEKLWVEVERK